MPAYDIGPRIGIEGEKEFTNSIKAIDSQVRALGNELKTLSKEYDENDRSVEGVTKKQQTLSKAIGASKDQIKLLTSQYTKQYGELKKLENQLAAARKQNGENSEEALKAEAALAKQAKTVNDLGARLERAKGQLLTFENQMEELGNSATRAGETLQSAGEKIAGIGGKLSSAGNVLTGTVTAPLLAAGAAAVNLGNDFEDQMSRVQAIAGATSTELEALADQALQLGADTSFSASEVAEGMENLASAGFTVEEIMAAMSGMLDLAASSGADLATSSEIAASAIRGFGLDASDAAHVADVFAEAAARTNAQTEDMGEAMKYVAPVASAMSQSLEETAAAIGIMSDAGIKGSQAGTSLRGALSRLAKPTKPMIETMTELGLSFYDASGNMLPLNQMVEQLQDRFQGLTQEQQNNALVTLFGQESLSGMLALIQRGPEELRNLTSSFKNSSGAAAKMAETMLDNTTGTIEEMTGSLETAGITIQRVLAPYIRDAAKAVTGLVNDFSDLDDEQQKSIIAWAGLAAAAGPTVKIVGTAAKGLGSLAKGAGAVVGDLGKLRESGGKATDSMSAFGKVLGTLGPKGIIVGGVVAGAAAIGAAVLKTREDMIQAEIDEAFGDIKLSAEEVEDVAQRLTATEWTVKIDAAVEAREKVFQFKEELASTLEELNKTAWKVSVGLALSEEEKSSYLSNVQSFTQSASEYLAQQGYSIDLALGATFGEGDAVGDSLADFSSSFLTKAQGELERLGAYLAAKVNDSFENNTFARDQVEIRKIIDKMTGILTDIQNAEQRAKLSNLQVEYAAGGFGIDQDSFNRLNEEISKNTQELMDSAEKTKLTALTAVEFQYDEMLDQGASKEFADKVREDARRQIEAASQQNVGESINIGFDFAFQTIANTKFKEEIESAKNEVAQLTEEYSGTFLDAFEKGGMEIQNAVLDFTNQMPLLSEPARKTVNEMLDSLAPQKQHLEAIREQCIAAGEEVPKSVSEGLSKITLWEAMAGDTSAMYDLLARSLAESPEKLKALQEAQNAGQVIPEELAAYITMYSHLVYDANTGMWTQLEANTTDEAQYMADMLNKYGQEFDESLAQGIASQYGLVYENGKWMVDKAAQGVRDQKGKFVDASGEVADAGVDEMNRRTGGATLSAPGMETPDWTDKAASGRGGMQSWLNVNPLSVSAYVSYIPRNTIPRYYEYANGGLVDQPQFALIGEAGDEMVIPLERNRERAMDLWREAGERLNAFAADQGRSVGSAARERLIQQNEDHHRELHLAEGAVVIHTQAVDGKRLYREFIKEMRQEVNRKVAAHGTI